ncbi:peptidylprolyl isomerase [Sphingomicrobium nitratireducens]|uniref:peptidylprolyl isomerase n=1 Tax=Sphingomicrobium nitratireducens TaxID=2964666 RepID=UPI00223FB422|nr:peptidylprolyl isomerase [Sphingomicrobium nitratireducens]
MIKSWKNAFLTAAGMGLAASAATAAMQDAPEQERTYSAADALALPDNPQLFGKALPSVVKATAIVNGEVITQTDIDERVAFMLLASGAEPSAEEIADLRQQVLRNLIDEMLQIQAAKAEEIEIREAEVEQTLGRIAADSNRTVEQLGQLLVENGSSLQSMRQQIRGEIAWGRLQQAKIESFVSVGDEEVQAVIDRLNASKGTTEYRVGEIFLSATPANSAQVRENALRILDALRDGGSFVAYARQYSEASTAAVGGDLGWVRPEQLPAELARALGEMQAGSVSIPIQIPGGFSILAVQDTRTILTADPRNAVLSLKQVTVPIAPGTSETAANQLVDRFADAAASVGGCGGAEKLAADFGGQVVSSDAVPMKDLPPALQQMMLEMQVGQATRPFGSLQDGVRALVLCGREEEKAGMPSFDQVQAQLNDERVNLRARRYLRDLRRDAVIDYR